MNDPNPCYNATYHDDFDFTVEKLRIADEMMTHYFENERDRTIDKLRWLDRLLGRKQTIPKRVR